MDTSAILVVIVLTLLSLAAIVGLEIFSRKKARADALAEETVSGPRRNSPRNQNE